MTSLYLCHGQQSLCYLITERGSQETDEHPEITQFYNLLSKVRHCSFSLSAHSLRESGGTLRGYLLAPKTLGSMILPPGLSSPLKTNCSHFPFHLGQSFSHIICCYFQINILI